MTGFVLRELDTETAGAVSEHIAECSACKAKLAATERIVSRLNDLEMEEMPMSTEIAVLNRIDGYRKPHNSVLWLFRRPVWSAVASLVVIVLVASLLLLKQQPSSAGQIIEKAKEHVSKMRSIHAVLALTQPQRGGPARSGRAECWYRGPDSLRILTTNGVLGTASMVCVGGKQIYYVGEYKTAVISPISTKEVQNQWIVSGVQSPADVVKRFRSPAYVAGTERVAGRICDIIETISNGSRIRLSVDRISGFIMRYAVRSGASRTESRVISLEVDKPVSDKCFDLSVPPGTHIARAPLEAIHAAFRMFSIDLTDPSEAGGIMQSELQQNKLRGRKSIAMPYILSYIPSGYGLYYPELFTQTEGIPAKALTIYGNPKTGDTIVLEQKYAEIAGSGREVVVAGNKGKIAEFHDPYNYTVLTWKSNGSYFSLTGTNMSENEIVKIASSSHSVVGNKPAETWIINLTPSIKVDHQIVEKAVGGIEKRLSGLPGTSGSAALGESNLIRVKVRTVDIEGVAKALTTGHCLRLIGVPSNLHVREDTTGNTINHLDGTPVSAEELDRLGSIVLTGDDVESSEKQPMQSGFAVGLNFTPHGAKKFVDYTKKHLGGTIAIVLDDKIVSAPIVRQPAPADGRVLINGTSGMDAVSQALRSIKGSVVNLPLKLVDRTRAD
jgi:outer membrane lipoprotein-sorting protein